VQGWHTIHKPRGEMSFGKLQPTRAKNWVLAPRNRKLLNNISLFTFDTTVQSFQNGAPTSHACQDSVTPCVQVNLKGVHGFIGENHIATSTPNLPQDNGSEHIPRQVGLPATRTRTSLAHGPGGNTRDGPKDHFQAFLEVWADHCEGHIYQKFMN
jgi:hypothetical protein